MKSTSHLKQNQGLQKQKDLGFDLEFPDLSGAEYLISHLENMGYCENSGMGYVALSFTEIYNYMKATQTINSKWSNAN